MIFSYLFGGIARALGTKQYLYFWAGNGISTIGRWTHRVAVGWLTWQLTESEAWLGVVAFADLFPTVVIPIFAGVLSDRMGFVRIMRYAVFCAGLAAAMFSVLVGAGLINIYLIVALSALVGTLEAFSGPARISIVQILVPRQDLSAAIALNTATFNAARLIGPAIAGVLLVWTNVTTALAFNAASYMVFFAVLLILEETPGRTAMAERRHMAVEIWEGVRFIIFHPGVRVIMIMIAATALLIRPVIELLPGFAVEVFRQGPDGLAMLLSSMGFGAMLSGLWLARRGETQGLTRLVVWSFLATAIALLLFTVTKIFWIGVASIFSVGLFLLIGGIASQSLVQNMVAPELRARVMSLYMVTSFGMPSVGALLMGGIASVAGLQITIAVGAVMAAALWIWLARIAMGHAAELEKTD